MQALVRGKRAKRATVCWIAQKRVLSVPSCSPLLYCTRVFRRSLSLDFLGFSEKPISWISSHQMVFGCAAQLGAADSNPAGCHNKKITAFVQTRKHLKKHGEKKRALLGMPGASCTEMLIMDGPHFQFPCFRRRCFLSIPNLFGIKGPTQSTRKIHYIKATNPRAHISSNTWWFAPHEVHASVRRGAGIVRDTWLNCIDGIDGCWCISWFSCCKAVALGYLMYLLCLGSGSTAMGTLTKQVLLIARVGNCNSSVPVHQICQSSWWWLGWYLNN